MFKKLIQVYLFSIIILLPEITLGQDAVKLYEEPLILPTYEIGEPDKNPIFYTNRAYQGAKGEVYPYPLQDNLTDNKVNKKWKALILENEFIKIAVLPEMGGKMWYAIDKTNGYDFIYYNEQVKPALIGMLGAWTSGGLEWNIPHHHRASTYMPVDYEMEKHSDGSKTIWIGEIERRHRMEWRVGYTVHPGKSYLETEIKLYNRTPVEHSFLIFANTAVHANENYQVIFPPSTQYGTSHSKTAFTEWPISNQQYGAGQEGKEVDVSWWKNHPTPISIFDFGSGNFVAGYDHGRNTGTLIWGNPHIMTGRKFFEWGPGPAGSMWDDILTDSSGPYLELMAGAYSDNQPDYSWVNPTMVKSARMFFSPLQNIKGVKKVNNDAAINLKVEDTQALLGINTTSTFNNTTIYLRYNGEVLFDQEATIGPSSPFVSRVDLPKSVNKYNLHLELVNNKNKTLIEYQPQKQPDKPMPEAVKPPKLPEKIKTVEQLYREGLRLEQFYNPTLDPLQYYDEALKRDSTNSLVNNQLGIYYLKRGNYELAESHLRTAANTITQDYTAPKNAESLYYLGLTLFNQGSLAEAYKWLYKSTWDFAWHSPAYNLLAKIDVLNGDYQTALEHINRSLSTNVLNKNAKNLKTAILRRLEKKEEAISIVHSVLEEDPMDTWATNELYLLRESGDSILKNLRDQMDDDVESYLELATDYGKAGFYKEAIDILDRASGSEIRELTTYPMVYYYRGYYYEKLGKHELAKLNYKMAASKPSDYCFPYRFESIDVLETALESNPSDAKAHYYLGNLFYDNIPERAISEWKRSIELDASFPIAHRNLAFAYAHIHNKYEKAAKAMEIALKLNPDDPRYYAELDQYYENSSYDPQKRLSMLEENHKIVKQDDTALSREISLLIFHGRYTDAIEILQNHHFRKIEGVGNIHNKWVDAHLLRGRKYIEQGEYNKAIADFEKALTYPENLEVGAGNREGEVYYFMGEAYMKKGESKEAHKYYRMSTESNYAVNEMKYRQAHAYEKLGEKEIARNIFHELIEKGEVMLSGDQRADFFEKFSGDESENARKADAHYLIGLGKLGLGNTDVATEEFNKVLKLNPAHLGAKVMLK